MCLRSWLESIATANCPEPVVPSFVLKSLNLRISGCIYSSLDTVRSIMDAKILHSAQNSRGDWLVDKAVSSCGIVFGEFVSYSEFRLRSYLGSILSHTIEIPILQVPCMKEDY